MAALKGAAIESFLRSPDRAVVLVYGPDSGLVRERAGMLLETVDTGGDPFARVVIDGDALSSDPGRLADEARTVPLFGGRRAIRVTQTQRNVAPAAEALLADPPTEALVVIEAGDLKPSAPLRKAFERAATGAAIACYADEGRDLDRLIDEVAGSFGLTVAPDARAALSRLIGADRLATRRELEKLATYCHGTGRIEAADVAEISGDAAAFALDNLIDAVGLGDAGAADRALRKAWSAGLAPAAVVNALGRHFLQLSAARGRVDRGETADAAMRALKPPVFFKRQAAFRRQLGQWSPKDLDRALELVGAAEIGTRRLDELSPSLVARTVLTLARAAGSRR